MEESLGEIAEICALTLELCVAVTVMIGAAGAVVKLIRGARRSTGALVLIRGAWLYFAAWILLSLEFALGADIVRSAVAPTWDDIGKLAAIATIRTLLNFFLARDVKEFGAQEAEEGSRT